MSYTTRTRTFAATQISLDHPTVIAPAPSTSVSKRYAFIPTHQVVEGLQSRGWAFEGGTCRSTRDPLVQGFATHVLKFTHSSLPKLRDGSRPQAVIVNSHQGSSAFQLGTGFFRIACANGLIVQSADCGSVRLRHVGLVPKTIFDAVEVLLSSIPRAVERIDEWSDIQLPGERQIEFAARAAQLRWPTSGGPSGLEVSPHHLLAARRSDDQGQDLWRTFNRIQEGVIRGGVWVKSRDNDGVVVSRRRATGIRGVTQQVDLNRQLWSLAEEFALQA